eukprot:1283247-Rhodomonas_salina.1
MLALPRPGFMFARLPRSGLMLSPGLPPLSPSLSSCPCPCLPCRQAAASTACLSFPLVSSTAACSPLALAAPAHVLSVNAH